jgi:hypothetical protein
MYLHQLDTVSTYLCAHALVFAVQAAAGAVSLILGKNLTVSAYLCAHVTLFVVQAAAGAVW